MDFIESLIGRPNTIKTYKSLYENHIEDFVKNRTSFQDRDVIKFLQRCSTRSVSISTTKAATSLFCRYVEWKTGVKLPFKQALRTVSRQNQEIELEIPSKELLYDLLNKAKTQRLYTPMLIALLTGMRKGEVLGLKWQDIDFVRDLLTIRRSYDGPTKNGKTRVIPLHPRLKKELFNILPINSDNYMENKVIPVEFDPNKDLQSLCKRTKIKPFTFHTLRHCFASYGLEGGTDFNRIQKILGHSNLSTTVNFYWKSAYKPEEIDLTFI